MAFISHNLEDLRELIVEKTTLYDLTEGMIAENYILIYFPRIKHYSLNTVENFIEEYPFIKWIYKGNIK